jgi:hypothetical protein
MLSSGSIFAIVIILIGLFSLSDNTVSYSSPSVVTESSRNANLSEHSNIYTTLRIVADKLQHHIDVNNDAQTNCIDAAVTFYKYYHDKSKVRIIVNVNSKSGFNHLFNSVFTDRVWKEIEPQAYYSNRSNYLMSAVWGKKYDKTYNVDVTEKYKIYAK